MSGDVSGQSAIIWSRTDRPARMIIEYNAGRRFGGWRRIDGPAALADTDFSARVDLSGLPPNREVEYRVRFKSLDHPRAISEALHGSFTTPSVHRRSVSFTFSGDEAGQGWGINPDFDGYRLYQSMREKHPDFFIHSGDQIYADGPLKAEVTLDDGSLWKNMVTPAKSAVAQTLEDFRGNFAYNLMDHHKRAFAAEVPFLVQWDDHETRNNWYPGEVIGIPATQLRGTLPFSPRGPARRCSSTTRSASTRWIRTASIARSTTGRCWMCSCSTNAATAGQTHPMCRPHWTPHPLSSGPRNSTG